MCVAARRFVMLGLATLPLVANAQSIEGEPLDLSLHWIGFASVGIFFLAYTFAMLEESTMLRKSKPMVFAASLIWVLIASVYVSGGMGEQSGAAFRRSLEGYAELFLFILVSMTYLNAMEQRGVFDALRIWLLSKGFGYRKLFWITGIQSFFLSAVCNNLTTALLMGAVVMAMAKDNRRFITVACVNIVVATNAGGSFSPFGDITTLLAWQKGVVPFLDFFSLFIPSFINFAVPAAVMHFWIPRGAPASAGRPVPLRRGALGIIVLFALTILTAVSFEHFLQLPPAAGMLAGLSYLSFYFYFLYKTRHPGPRTRLARAEQGEIDDQHVDDMPRDLGDTKQFFDVFHNVALLEWDTLLFFYGVMVSVGGLNFIGYGAMASKLLYTDLDPTVANVLVGIASAFVDNGTIMYAVLTMGPALSQGQWLLVTLTAGVGGSLLAIGSAAGVGLLGQAKGAYTFSSHLRWAPVIALGFIASILAHFVINARFF
ncbi:MAG: sodium:proton antiporter NhaD [Methylotetracoccus sp.]|nr:sodium:proton antiporter NhaD [Methylotetracoccus sp.]